MRTKDHIFCPAVFFGNTNSQPRIHAHPLEILITWNLQRYTS